MKRNLSSIFPAVLGMIFLQCDPFEKMDQTEIKLSLPDQTFKYDVPGASDDLATLGRVLFYDPRLSINNTVSCGSCHKQALAFSDNARFSRGFENRLTTRNSMPIQNIISKVFETNFPNIEKSDSIIQTDGGENQPGYLPGVVPPPDFLSKASSLFWDGREHDLQVMVTRPIVNHVEMGIHDLDKLAQKLSQIPEYKTLFANAFGQEEFNSQNIALGLSAFLLSIRSNQSKLDKSVTNGEILFPLEQLGKDLFFNKFKCNACHERNGFANIGLDAVTQDVGQFLVTGLPQDAGKFKIPSLRNVQLTGPPTCTMAVLDP